MNGGPQGFGWRWKATIMWTAFCTTVIFARVVYVGLGL
jgi:hypothetical protein